MFSINLRQSETSIVAYCNMRGRCAGVAELDWVPVGLDGKGCFWVSRVFVHPTFRGKGLATQLLTRVCEALDDLGQRAYLYPNPYDGSDYDRLVALYERFGFVRHVKNWGTKWGACGGTLEEGEDYLELYFETAWSFPEPIFHELLKKYPELVINGEVDEEGGLFHLDIQDNELIWHEGVRKGGPYDYEGEEEESESAEAKV